MAKLKVAILEDNKELLKELKQNLESTNLVEVILWSTNSEDFLEKVKNNKPEALILDIELVNDSLDGIEVAEQLKLHVLFVSGKTQYSYQRIEELNINNAQITVEHISKPITLEKLNKILPKFINEITLLGKVNYVYLYFNDSRNKIAVDTIVNIETDTGKGGESNNKIIYFTNRKPEILIDFSFTRMEEKGFSNTQFITIHKSFRVNADKIKRYIPAIPNHLIEVEVYDSEGKTKTKMLPVSENFQKDVRKFR